MSNSGGSYAIKITTHLDACDRLPEAVRLRVKQCNCDWVVTRLLKRWDNGTINVSGMITLLDQWDQNDTDEHFARLNRMLETGVDYHGRLTRKAKKQWKDFDL